MGPERGGVTRLVAAAELKFLEAVVVGDLVPVGVEDVLVAVPDLGAAAALALFDDLRQRRQHGLEVVDRDEPPGGVPEVLAADLVRRVAAEHLPLAEPVAQAAQPLLDRRVELPDRLVCGCSRRPSSVSIRASPVMVGRS
ncbi:MAG: hypothetical protein HOW71_24475 [Nonomuraea sp.]|nr:hypothetical protein [Nonomuraea sp.]NUP65319.1 hypothetical protein [Nonomuraea sp.]